jgi:hypothetical protein
MQMMVAQRVDPTTGRLPAGESTRSWFGLGLGVQSNGIPGQLTWTFDGRLDGNYDRLQRNVDGTAWSATFNGNPTEQGNFTSQVGEDFDIDLVQVVNDAISKPNLIFTAGTAGAFTFDTGKGFPGSVNLTEVGALPAHVTFRDNHDGTATLAGMPTAAGIYSITVTTSNAVGSINLSYTLTVRPGTPVRLLFLNQPRNAPANGLLPPFQVLLLDRFGNPASGTVRVALIPIAVTGPAGFSRGRRVQASAVNGIAMVSQVAISTRGRYRLLAYVDGVGELSDPFDVGLHGRGSG